MPAKKKTTGIKKKVIQVNKKKQKTVHTKKEQLFHLLQQSNNYFIFGLTGILSLFLIFFIGWHLFTSSSFDEKIPQNTQKFFHINVDDSSKELFKKISPLLFKTKLQKYFDASLYANLQQLTFLADDKNNLIFFLENASKKKVRSFLEKFTVAQESIEVQKKEGISEISIKQGEELYCMYENRTLYCSQEKQALEIFLPHNFLAKKNLKKNIRNLPSNAKITWFVDSKSFSTPFLETHKKSLKEIFGTLSPKKGNIEARFYAVTDEGFSSREHEKYKHNSLNRYFSKLNTLGYVSGQNFEKKWKHTENFYTENSPEYALILKGILLKKFHTFFGNEKDFYKDFLPLFQGLYAFGVTEIKEQVHLNFIAEGKNTEGVEKLLEAFFEQRGNFTVEKKILELGKDVVFEQIWSNEDKIQKVNERAGASRIIGYEIADHNWGFFTAQKGTLIFVSTSLEGLKELLQRKKEFISLPQELSGASEFGQISLESIQKLFAFSPFGIPNLENLEFIKSISWETQSFPAGVSIVGDIELRE